MDILSAPMALMDFLLYKILPFIFVLSIVVFFHELGHFLVARWNKVKVDAFSLGFGPEIFGFYDKRKTRWKFCAIPLGGYVKFHGDADATSKPNREALAAMNEDEREGAFEHKALWRRAAVVVAGPVANFILASVIYTALFMYSGDLRLAPVIGEVMENSAAQEAGMKVGDRILSVQGNKISDFEDIGRYTYIGSDESLSFGILRNGKEIELTAVPKMVTRKDQFGNEYSTGLIGVRPFTTPEYFERVQLGFGAAFVKSLDSIGQTITRTYHFIRELIQGKQDSSQLRGPLGIGHITSQVATLGIIQLLGLAAALSVSIGIMNLLPVPMLDGGHLMFYAFEAVRGKALSPKAQDFAFRIGLSCVLMLMVFVTFNDIRRIFGFFG